MSRISLFQRLAAADPGRLVVVAPGRRLARSLARDYDAWQVAQGRKLWETPDILPIAALVAKLYDQAQHDPSLPGVRAPLSTAQERALWEAVVEDSDVALAAPSAAAALASEAWALAHEWRIVEQLRHCALTEDTRAFVSWAASYAKRVEALGALDPARLTDAVTTLVRDGRLSVAGEVLLVGFNELSPQQSALVDSFAARGSRCAHWQEPAAPGEVCRAPADDARDEVERMADWVAQHLRAEPGARVGVVVPDLAARRRSITRALDQALEANVLLAPADRVRPYTVSLGAPLADAPLVATALRLFRLLVGEVGFADASALVRSRHVDLGADAGRERFDAEVRRRAARSTSLAHLLALARPARDEEATPLHFTLGALNGWRATLGSARRRCSEWAVLLMEPLRILGFPGPHALDSAEYQTLVRWRELLTEFAALDRVQPAVDLRGAVTRLGRLAAGTVFQPEGGDPPVQVLGLLEANGLTFDHLWVAGLTSEAWPPAVRAHPLLPLELQRARRMPGADVDTELVRARALLERLTRSARHIVASHATRDGDRPVVASSMIATWPAWTPVARAPRAVDVIPPVRLESVPYAAAPPLRPTAVVRGGATTLRDQAACPFRAFAAHRLNAGSLDEPHDGLDAAERGQLIHAVLAQFWDGLPERSRAHLAAMPDSERTARLERAADQALARVRRWRAGAVGDALTALERRRLVNLSLRWLQFEVDQRGDFTVVATEETRELAIGPLHLKGRLDRVDRLPGGRTVVIDYKTGGGAGTGAWLGRRPGEPQLPLYLVATERDAAGIAFARVRAGETRFIALAEEEGLLPGARLDWKELYPSWTALVEAWRVELETVAEDFFRGCAEVAPKRGDTCRNCGLDVLCRLNERAGGAAGETQTDGDARER